MGLAASTLGCRGRRLGGGGIASSSSSSSGGGGPSRRREGDLLLDPRKPGTVPGAGRLPQSRFRYPLRPSRLPTQPASPPPSPKDAVHAPSLVKDVQRLVGADASAVRAQLGSHFTLTSRRTKKRFVYDGKAAPQCRDRRRSVRVPAIGSGDFESYQLLGRGGFGAVFRAARSSTGAWYALKVQPMESMARSCRSGTNRVEDETVLHMERTVLAACRGHPFIVSLEYAFHTRRYAVLAMEYVEGGNLSHLIASSPCVSLPFHLARTYTMEIALALNFMHGKGIIYRDLKPSNILIDRRGHLKLTDFGLSGSMVKHKKVCEHGAGGRGGICTSGNETPLPPFSPSLPRPFRLPRDEPTGSTDDLSESSGDPEVSDQEHTSRQLLIDAGSGEMVRWVRRRTVCGTVGYRPPEQVQERYTDYSSRIGYDERADWFALGVCCYIMVTGRRPFPTTKELQESERSLSTMPTISPGTSWELIQQIGKLSKHTSRKVLSDAEFRCLMFEVPFPTKFDSERNAESFIKALIARDPKERMRFCGLVAHPWMRGEDFSIECILQRHIPKWVKDHAYLQLVRLARKDSTGHERIHSFLRQRPREERRQKLHDCIEDMCRHCQETKESTYAYNFTRKWKACPSKKSAELFRHWAFMSEDAIALEIDSATSGAYIL